MRTVAIAVRALGGLVAAGLALGGCASTNMADAEVRVPALLDEACLEGALRAEPDVVGFRQMVAGGRRAYWFQLAAPDLSDGEMPSFLARQLRIAGNPTVMVEANFRASDGSGSRLRKAVLEREQEILERVVATCTDSEVEFGEPAPCGAGETNTLCVEGRARRR